MSIVETNIITRANTSINWPSQGVPDDPNNPSNLTDGSLFTKIDTVSEDGLTKTRVRTFVSKEAFIKVKTYANVEIDTAYFNTMIVPGITFTKTIVTN